MNAIKILPKGFTAKMVRERWFNHLDPEVDKGPWTADEDVQLISLVELHGRSWSKVSKSLRTRTEHMVKNRFLLLKREAIRSKYLEEHQSSFSSIQKYVYSKNNEG
jgi:hypothetical protein